MNVLITGAAGFIGSALARRLADRGDIVMGIDNINSYYDPRLKIARLAHFYGISPEGADEAWGIERGVPAAGDPADTEVQWPAPPYGVTIQSPVKLNLSFKRVDITDAPALESTFREFRPQRVVNLAAQAGVRYSLQNPLSYVATNVTGFAQLLECCRRHGVDHLVYASSSSVYGGNTKTPFSEADRVDSPVSVYAATKKADELLASVYAHLYGLPVTGLRYFTVYGPWGRPDMAAQLFASAMSQGRPIKVFNGGDMARDFTFIDDIVEGTVRVLDTPARGAEVYNIGCGHPEPLERFITLLEQGLGMTARRQMLPMQPGDVHVTYADTSRLARATGYTPRVGLDEGVRRFTDWYRRYRP